MKPTILIAVIITLGLLALCIILIVDLHRASDNEVVNRFHDHQSMIVRQLTQEIERYLRTRSRGAQVLSTFASIQHRDMKKMAADLQEYFGYVKKDYVKAISVYDEKGTIIYSTTQEAIGRNYAESDFFQWATRKENKGKQFVSSLLRATQNEIERPPYFRFVIATPIYQEARDSRSPKPTHQLEADQLNESNHRSLSDKFVGVLTYTVALDEVTGAFLQLAGTSTDTRHIWIMDTHGTVLFQSEHPEMAMKSIRRQDSTCMRCHSSFDYVETILAEKQGTIEYAQKGQPTKAAAFAPLRFENVSWIIVFNVPLNVVSGFVDRQLERTFFLIGVIAIALVSSSVLIYRSNRLKIRAQEEAKQWREKRELEEKIRESEERYRQLVEISPDAIAVHCEGKIVFVNPAAVQLLGAANHDDLIGKPALEIVHPEDREKVKQRIAEIFQEGRPAPLVEERFLSMDGSVIDVEVAAVSTTHQNKPAVQVVIRDITERKRAEEALKAGEERQGLILQSLPVAIYNAPVDPDVDAIWFSGNVFELTGYSASEFVTEAHFWRRRLHPDDRSRVLEAFEWAGAGVLGEVNIEYRWQTKDGQYKWFLDRCVKHEAGKKQEYFGVIVDITERKRAEEEISTLAHALRSISECVSITDMDDTVLFVNEAFLKTYGYVKHELLGRHISIVRSPNNPPEVVGEILPSTLRGGWHGELLNRKKDGSEFPIFLSTSVVHDDKGQPVALIGVAADITERKRAEEALKENEQRFRSLTEFAITGVYLIQESLFRYVNPVIATVFGYSVDEIVNKLGPLDLVAPEDHNIVTENIRKRLEGEASHLRYSFKGLRKDGQRIDIEVYGTRIDYNGKPAIIGMLLDITERKQAEQELVKAKERAERSDKLKDAFIANISHEIRTPLNIILGYTDIVQDIYAANASEPEKNFFRSIHNGANRLMRTVELILNVSRAQAGDITLNMEAIHLPILIEKLFNDIAPLAGNKSLDLFFENEYGYLSVNADEYCLSQALMNLLDNAIKYTKQGSITARLYQKNTDVCLDITDTGIGISEKYLPEIFRPYSQEEIGYSRAYEGIGLGLTLVQQYLALHDVPITVTSTKGVGTTFTIYLTNIVLPSSLPESPETIPIDKKQSIPVLMPDESSLIHKPVVLVVEDDQQTQVFLNVLLSPKFEVIAADSSESAWEKIQSRPIDLILMDISIQGPKTGLALTREIRADEKYSDIPIIAVTAHAFPADKQRSLEAGCNGYIAKPMNQTKLFQMISEVMKRE